MEWSMTARRRFAAATIVALAAFGTGCSRDFTGKVVGVTDGDTFVVMQDAQRVRVRLWQVDAPEFPQRFGSRARLALLRLVYEQQVQVRFVERDAQGDVLAQVTVDGRDINREMVALGMAWTAPDTPPQMPLVAVQETARSARLGLWEDPHPVPPWEWRDRQSGALRTSGAP